MTNNQLKAVCNILTWLLVVVLCYATFTGIKCTGQCTMFNLLKYLAVVALPLLIATSVTMWKARQHD